MLTSRKSLSTNSVADCSKEIEGRKGGGGGMQYAGKVFCVLTHPHCYFLLVPVVRHLPVPHPFFSCTTEALRIPPAFHLSCYVQTWWNYWRVLECHLGASWRLLEETPGFRSYDRFYSCKIQEKKFLNLSVLLGSLSSITLS